MRPFALVLLLLACAPATQVPTPARHSATWQERVDHYDGCTELSTCWRFAPYYRLTDPVGVPGWWVVSIRGNACLISTKPPAPQPVEHELWECAWRLPRPV